MAFRPCNPGQAGVRDDDGVVDGLAAAARGRGAGLNPANRFESVRLTVLGDALDDAAAENPDGVQHATTVLPDSSRTIINEVDSPDLSFRWTINPYRGCEHGCIYCYARPGHEYLGMSSGLDFETKILAKTEAPKLLRAELAHPRWKGDSIMMSGVTDPYQPIERRLRITRACLEVMAECNQPVAVITKNALVVRDLDLLAPMAAKGIAGVAISITSLDPALAAVMEPRASAPARRLAAVKALSDAGVPVTVMTAPIVPGLNDREIPALLEAAADAGAKHAGWVMVRLPWQIKELFTEWLKRAVPDKAARVESLIRQVRGGDLYDATPHERMRGVGPLADQIDSVFKVFARRFGLDSPHRSLRTDLFRRPDAPGQLGLFAGA